MATVNRPKKVTLPLSQTEIHKHIPFGRWEIVDVKFPDSVDTDYVIPHNLTPSDPKNVQYYVLRATTPGNIYEAGNASGKQWTSDYIVLRSDTVEWTGRLLLTTLKDPLDFKPSSL